MATVAAYGDGSWKIVGDMAGALMLQQSIGVAGTRAAYGDGSWWLTDDAPDSEYICIFVLFCLNLVCI